jgi:hypothetical protein
MGVTMSRDFPVTDDERRYIAMWRRRGGGQHGPMVEQVYMPYEQFFEFCKALESAAVEQFKSGLDAIEDAAKVSKRQSDQLFQLTLGVGRRFDQLLTAARTLLAHYDENVCHHHRTHRGGTNWTICDDCKREWADDEGGFQPHEEPPEIAHARALLDTWS